MPSAETKRPKRHRSANIDTTEDLLDEWLAPKNNPVMQGLVSFLNVQPTRAASPVSVKTLSPGDNVDVDSNELPLPTSVPTERGLLSRGLSNTVAPGDNVVVSDSNISKYSIVKNGDKETLSPPDKDKLSPGDNDAAFCSKVVAQPVLRKKSTSDMGASYGGEETSSPSDAIHSGLGYSSTVSDREGLSSQSTGIAIREQQLQVRPLTRAEDGHSGNEQRTYLALWNAGNPVLGQPFRRNTIGHAGLAKMLKVDKRQIKRWIPALVEKLTIEIEIESSYATKTTYRVFDRDEIHARRVRAGYTSFTKNRGGVELLVKPRPLTGGDKYSVSPGDIDYSRPGDNEQRKTVFPRDTVSPHPRDTVSPGGGDTVSPPYKEVNSKTVFKEDSSSEVRIITHHLHNIGVDADDDFAHQLLRRSRAVCEDATIAEILHFTEAKARYRGIQKSLTGFLLTAVPICLTGESFRLYRQAELARAVAERESWIQMRSEAERTLYFREGREAWEVENAESTLKWLREQQPWVFDAEHSSN